MDFLTLLKFFQVAELIEGPIAKDFIAPISPQPNMVTTNLNFGQIYSELVKAKYSEWYIYI